MCFCCCQGSYVHRSATYNYRLRLLAHLRQVTKGGHWVATVLL